MVTSKLISYGRTPRMVSCASRAELVFQQMLRPLFAVGLRNAWSSGQQGDSGERRRGQL